MFALLVMMKACMRERNRTMMRSLHSYTKQTCMSLVNHCNMSCIGSRSKYNAIINTFHD